MKIETSKPGKQRKLRYTAPNHQRHKLLTAPLHPSLAEKQTMKKLPVRVGDTVIVTRGSFRDIEGKVTEVDTKNIRISVENVTSQKTDGSQYFYPLSPSNVMITKLKSDKKRRTEKEPEAK